MILTHDWQCKQVQTSRLALLTRILAAALWGIVNVKATSCTASRLKPCVTDVLWLVYLKKQFLKGLNDLHSLKCSGDTSVLDASRASECTEGQLFDALREMFWRIVWCLIAVWNCSETLWMDIDWVDDMIQHRAKWAKRECLMIYSPLFFLCCKKKKFLVPKSRFSSATNNKLHFKAMFHLSALLCNQVMQLFQ